MALNLKTFGGTSHRFDLRGISGESYRAARPFRFLFIAMVGVFVVILVDACLVLHASAVYSSNWWSAVVAIVIAGVLIPPSLWSISAIFSRGPDAIELTPEAIVLDYGASRPIAARWDQLSLKIRIDTFSPFSSSLTGSSPSETISLKGPWRKYTRINQDVSSAIVNFAEVKGMLVKRSSSQRSDGTWHRVLIIPSPVRA